MANMGVGKPPIRHPNVLPLLYIVCVAGILFSKLLMLCRHPSKQPNKISIMAVADTINTTIQAQDRNMM